MALACDLAFCGSLGNVKVTGPFTDQREFVDLTKYHVTITFYCRKPRSAGHAQPSPYDLRPRQVEALEAEPSRSLRSVGSSQAVRSGELLSEQGSGTLFGDLVL